MTDADRELIELAARAAGHKVKGWINGRLIGWDAITGNEFAYWNPLEDSGDAFRLAVQLSIDTKFLDGFKQVCCRRHSDRDNCEMHGLVGYGNGTDPQPTAENVRRAIVRAAAEIGRGANKLRQAKGDGMNPKDFFSKYGREQIEIGCPWVTVEEMYQAFKARMMDELCVNLKQAGKVEDDDGHSYFVDGELVDKE